MFKERINRIPQLRQLIECRLILADSQKGFDGRIDGVYCAMEFGFGLLCEE